MTLSRPGIEIWHPSDALDTVVAGGGGARNVPAATWPAPALAVEEELALPPALELAALHAELSDLPDFGGVMVRRGRLFITWRAKPSTEALASASARTAAHWPPPG